MNTRLRRLAALPGLVMAGCLALPALAEDVGVSITIGEPGYYGRIDIGDAPRPRLLYPEPVLIVRSPPQVVLQPVYLRVPPGHAHDWSRYCGGYNACDQRVYFVQDDWYSNEYAPHYRKQHGGKGNGHDNGHGNDHKDKH